MIRFLGEISFALRVLNTVTVNNMFKRYYYRHTVKSVICMLWAVAATGVARARMTMRV